MNSSKDIKEQTKLIFALEEAIESQKANLKSEDPFYGQKNVNINGFDISVEVDEYSNNLARIKASHNNFKLEVIEENHEKKRLYPN